jgi:hypothetical protein
LFIRSFIVLLSVLILLNNIINYIWLLLIKFQ